MRPRLAALALAALLAALAACSGGAAPPEASTPIEATSAPAPPTATATTEATSTPEATSALEASPTPDARSGLELIEPAPGAFERRTFEDGEAIDWAHGVFVLDAETGRIEGYAVAGETGEHDYGVHPGGWITTYLSRGRGEAYWVLLLNTETGQSWRWLDTEALRLLAMSEQRLLFETRAPAGRFVVANRRMEEAARLTVAAARDDYPRALFSPDGRSLVLEAANKVYLASAATGIGQVLFDPPPRHGHGNLSLSGVHVDSRRRPPLAYAWIGYEGGGDGIVVTASYAGEDDFVLREKRYFGWDGEESPAPACPGVLSPDGRYAAVAGGGPYHVKYVGVMELESPWPSVTVTDAETCAPIFRVRSAHASQRIWSGEWLSTSGGFVVGVSGGYAVARVRGAPALLSLPSDYPGPMPAPAGGGRYFGYGSRVYDIASDRWRGPPEWDGGPFWWGDSHRERWFQAWVYWGEGGRNWLLLPSKIEYPPFADEIAFRVARTGGCLRLREEPGEEGRVLRCLPDGERLLFAERDAEAERDWAGRILSPHASITLRDGAWVYVRTEDGAEGWVSHDWLAHD